MNFNKDLTMMTTPLHSSPLKTPPPSHESVNTFQQHPVDLLDSGIAIALEYFAKKVLSVLVNVSTQDHLSTLSSLSSSSSTSSSSSSLKSDTFTRNTTPVHSSTFSDTLNPTPRTNTPTSHPNLKVASQDLYSKKSKEVPSLTKEKLAEALKPFLVFDCIKSTYLSIEPSLFLSASVAQTLPYTLTQLIQITLFAGAIYLSPKEVRAINYQLCSNALICKEFLVEAWVTRAQLNEVILELKTQAYLAGGDLHDIFNSHRDEMNEILWRQLEDRKKELIKTPMSRLSSKYKRSTFSILLHAFLSKIVLGELSTPSILDTFLHSKLASSTTFSPSPSPPAFSTFSHPPPPSSSSSSSAPFLQSSFSPSTSPYFTSPFLPTTTTTPSFDPNGPFQTTPGYLHSHPSFLLSSTFHPPQTTTHNTLSSSSSSSSSSSHLPHVYLTSSIPTLHSHPHPYPHSYPIPPPPPSSSSTTTTSLSTHVPVSSSSMKMPAPPPTITPTPTPISSKHQQAHPHPKEDPDDALTTDAEPVFPPTYATWQDPGFLLSDLFSDDDVLQDATTCFRPPPPPPPPPPSTLALVPPSHPSPHPMASASYTYPTFPLPTEHTHAAQDLTNHAPSSSRNGSRRERAHSGLEHAREESNGEDDEDEEDEDEDDEDEDEEEDEEEEEEENSHGSSSHDDPRRVWRSPHPSSPPPISQPFHQLSSSAPPPSILPPKKSHRSHRRWSKEEEKTLEQGMQEFGSKYSKILDHYGKNGLRSTILQFRDQGQLKDKARNIRTHREKKKIPLGPFVHAISSVEPRTKVKKKKRKS
ncbi:hypothetical protein HMI54_013740 [Coelomomyces lativittatus]|nr:hypothetical protein HMI56_006419 [Coelomomyces lativittatus]KAJ1514451.1 hypothetical protein HMI55_004648 [Coelomomyces lativittatus]KAJ1514670.1 hypothetical protein HMI54_013740 [Coelomomyces lativittatus]